MDGEGEDGGRHRHTVAGSFRRPVGGHSEGAAMIDVLIVSIVMPLAPCGGSGYYDPRHEICQPYLEQ